MLINGLFEKKTEENLIGMIYGQDGSAFVIEEIVMKYSKKLMNLKAKTNSNSQRVIVIKNNGSHIEPYDLAMIPLDLTESSSISNYALLEYLGHAGNINNLIAESIIDEETINLITTTNIYNNEFTNFYLASNQNIFHLDNILKTFSLQEKIKLYTENKHRTKEIMEEHKNDLLQTIKELLIEYAEDKSNFISENPSIIRNGIINTIDEFYENTLDLQFIKDEILQSLNNELREINAQTDAIELMRQSLQHCNQSKKNFKETKEVANKIISDLYDSNQQKITNCREKINNITHFPK